jgi:uncharacterized protein with von Willebrand factor type A (vWA) domain
LSRQAGRKTNAPAPIPRAPVAAGVSPRLASLAAALRAAGVECGLGELLTAHRALAAVEPRRPQARAALRASLCSSQRDLEVFDRLFDQLFADDPIAPLDPGKTASEAEQQDPFVACSPVGDKRRTPEEEGELERLARWSAIELLREKSFRAYTAGDRRLAREELRRLARTLPLRASARWRRAPGAAPRLDLRRTMRGAVRHGGEPRDLRHLRRRQRPRRLVFVCDVSGSMAPYATMALEYVHAVLRAGGRAEAFCFATRLTRVTAALAAADPAAALAAAEAIAPDRAGGTRIGAALAALNREHRHRLGRGAVVVVLSDGWDRGEPGLLAAEMARLRRTAHAVLWLDPHLADPGYEPLTRGLRESLPHVRASFPGDRLAGLAALTAAAARLQ